MSCVEASGLVHEVTNERYTAGRDADSCVVLDLECGGRLRVDPDEVWKSPSDVVTCFWCLVGASRWRMSVVTTTIDWKVTY